jgi:hypothetical protein
MIFEVELALERSGQNALVQVLMIGVGLGLLVGLVSADRQLVLLGGDRDFVGGESRQRQRDAVAVLAGADDVVGRVVVLAVQALGIVDEVEQALEADAGPP